MMWVWNEPCNTAQDCEWVNLHMSGILVNIGFVQGYEGIVLFIHIEVFDNAFSQEIVEVFQS